MKLLLLNYEYPPLGGGAGNATRAIAIQLAARKHDVSIITSNTKFSYKKIIDNGVKIYAVPTIRKGIHDCGFRGAITYILFAYFILIKLSFVEKYDVIHYFFSLPTAFFSLLPGKHRKLPYIISLRGSDVPMYDLYNKKLVLFHKFYLPLTKLIWKKAKAVVAVTNSLRQTALLTKPNQVIEVIPNGVDTNIFFPSVEYKENHNEFRLITVSRLIERKGIQNVLKALSDIKDNSIKLTIIGEGNYENELKKMCSNLDLTSSVTFLGFCERNTIATYLGQSDVFILLSLAEAFGNVIAEAMACKLPIISANEGGIPDLVGEENGILVDPENISHIISAIITMRNNKEMRTKMGESNAEKIGQKYSWKKIAIAYENIYQKI